ncbi:MAG: hypothetical protein ACRBG0_07180 [Lewinella sp.]|jgi:hypothetical protein|uniref:hypothetical protein n=1 Tax=Lewinella sp. TaxID=2004506 RepID=UPI003D6B64A9
MKSYFSSSLLLICTVFFFNTTINAHSVSNGLILENPPRWEKLGQRRVNYGLDRDEILVTAREGRFTSIRLKAEIAPINVHRCVVHFANGTTESFQFSGGDLRAGQVTRNLDLPGNRRIITKVVFWYDTKNRANRRGRVELWGKH